jgi:hypothetical protein
VLYEGESVVFFSSDGGGIRRRWRWKVGNRCWVDCAIVEMVGILTEGQYATMESARPFVFSRFAPSDSTSDVLWRAQPQMLYLKDCPQRNVVFMHNSVRLVGSLCHSAARSAILAVSSR